MQKQVDLPWRFLAYAEDGVRLAGFDCSGPQRPSVPSNSGAAPGSYNPEECMWTLTWAVGWWFYGLYYRLCIGDYHYQLYIGIYIHHCSLEVGNLKHGGLKPRENCSFNGGRVGEWDHFRLQLGRGIGGLVSGRWAGFSRLSLRKWGDFTENQRTFSKNLRGLCWAVHFVPAWMYPWRVHPQSWVTMGGKLWLNPQRSYRHQRYVHLA
jgi:hypothetical protein